MAGGTNKLLESYFKRVFNIKNSSNIHLFNSKNCLVKSNENKIVLVDGLDDFIVIDTENRLMILSTQNEQELKNYLKQIDKN